MTNPYWASNFDAFEQFGDALTQALQSATESKVEGLGFEGQIQLVFFHPQVPVHKSHRRESSTHRLIYAQAAADAGSDAGSDAAADAGPYAWAIARPHADAHADADAWPDARPYACSHGVLVQFRLRHARASAQIKFRVASPPGDLVQNSRAPGRLTD